LYYYFL